MLFTVKERLSFNRLYPKTGSLLSNSVIKSVEEKVRLSQDEIKLLDINENGSFSMANMEKVEDKEVQFSNIEIDELKRWVSTKDSAKEISQDIFDACQKINDLKKSS